MRSDCNCWVASEDKEAWFIARRGVHNVTCPIYRKSGDPVDRKHDERIRRLGEASKIKGRKGRGEA